MTFSPIPAPPAVDDRDGGFAVTGPDNVLGFRMLTLRRGLRLEIRTGMKMSRGISTLKILRNEGYVKSARKEAAYAELNQRMVEAGYADLPL